VRGVVGSYMIGLIAEAGIVTALNWVGLWLLGVPYALLLSIIAAVLNLIPYIGMIIATAFPATIALATMEPIYALWVVVLFAVVQFIDNNIIVPRIVGARVQLNALVSLVAVMVGGVLWGIPGMFLSLPIAAILKVVFDHTESMKAFGLLFGMDEPATNKGIFKRKRPSNGKGTA
jgi:predicted PurR-regulated permease PerM